MFFSRLGAFAAISAILIACSDQSKPQTPPSDGTSDNVAMIEVARFGDGTLVFIDSVKAKKSPEGLYLQNVRVETSHGLDGKAQMSKELWLIDCRKNKYQTIEVEILAEDGSILETKRFEQREGEFLAAVHGEISGKIIEATCSGNK